MKTKIYLLVLLFSFSATLKAQWQQTTGPCGGIVYSFTIDSNNIFISTWGGVFLSTDNGKTWQPRNTGLLSPYIHAVAVHGTTLFAADDLYGVTISTNYG